MNMLNGLSLDRSASAMGDFVDLTGSTLEFVTLARAAADVRLALEEAALAAEMSAARARSVADALASFSITDDGFIPLAPPYLMGLDTLLSPREEDVLALVAEGQTNKAIAEALSISPNTVKTHVSSLFNKLHVDSRVQLATMATKRELDHPGAKGVIGAPSVASPGARRLSP